MVIARRPSGLSKFPTSILGLPLGQLLRYHLLPNSLFLRSCKKWEVSVCVCGAGNLHQQLQNPLQQPELHKGSEF